MFVSYLTTANIIALIVSVVIPLLSALLSKVHWPSEVLGLITLALATANGFFTEWADAGSGFDWHAALGLSVSSFVVAVLSHYGVWKGTGTEAALLKVPERAKDEPTAPAPPVPSPAPVPPAAP